MYQILRQLDVDFILRSGTVDLDSLNWMVTSPFIKIVMEKGLDRDSKLIDFGSHIGSWALPLVKHFGCRAWCFEPDKHSLLLSRASAVLNQLDDRMTFIQAGIGGHDGVVTLYESDENWGHTLVKGGGPYNRLTGNSVEIQLLSLASALDTVSGAGKTVAKVNIEGAEHEMFLESSLQTILRVDLWVGEIHLDLGRTDFNSCIKKFEASGFCVRIIPSSVTTRMVLVACKA